MKKTKSWEQLAFMNADISMIPGPTYEESQSRVFHVQGTQYVFSKLSSAKNKAKEINSPLITQSKVEDGKEIFEDFYYFNDGKEWGKYRGKERID